MQLTGKHVRTTETKATHEEGGFSLPLFLNVIIKHDGSVEAKGCFAHVGHSINAGLIRLTTAQQVLIKGMLQGRFL